MQPQCLVAECTSKGNFIKVDSEQKTKRNANHMDAGIMLDEAGPRHVPKKKSGLRKIINNYEVAILTEEERSYNLEHMRTTLGACHAYREKKN